MGDEGFAFEYSECGGAGFNFLPEQEQDVERDTTENCDLQSQQDYKGKMEGDAGSFVSEDEVVIKLNSRVYELERKVGTLESELRLVRRKVRAMDISRYGYDVIAETVQRVLNDNSWNISRNKAQKLASSDDDDDEAFVRRMRRRHRHISGSKRPKNHYPLQQERELQQKRKYKALLSNDDQDSDYVPNSEGELSDYKPKVKKRQVNIETPSVKSKSDFKIPGRVVVGILKKENQSNSATSMLSSTKPKAEVDETAYENYKRLSTVGRKPKKVWVNFLTQRDTSGKIVSSICKLCKQKVSARPYRMDQHFRACEKKYSRKENTVGTDDTKEDSGPDEGIVTSEGDAMISQVDKNHVKRESTSGPSSSSNANGERDVGPMWEFFTQIKVNGQSKGKCKHCETLVSCRSARLRQHLRTCQSLEVSDFESD